VKTIGAIAIACAAVALSSSASASSVEAFVSTDDVRACAPTDDGAIWIATTGGVARVRDGTIERVFTKLDGLLDGKSNALLVDGADLWIGSEKGLIDAKPEGSALGVVASWPSPSVRSIARLEGKTFVATFGAGVESVSANGKLVPIAFADAKGPSARVRATSVVAYGGSIVAGTQGAGMFRIVDGKLVAMPTDGAKSVSTLAAIDGRLFVGALDGALSISDGVVRRESASDVRAFASFGTGVVAAGFGDGLLLETKNGLTSAPNAPDAKWLQAIGVRGDLRCIATSSGLEVQKGSSAWTRVAPSGLPSNDVTALARIDGRLFVATYDRGVASLSNGTWSTVAGAPKDARVDAMLADGKTLWVGTTRGLVKIDGAKSTTFDTSVGLPSDEVHAVASLGGGAIVVGTAKGIALVEGAKVTAMGKKQGLAIDAAWAVAKGPNGALLVGASTGLYVRRQGETKWTRYGVASGELPDDWVTAIAVEGDDVFVGTYAGGVARLTLGGESAPPKSLKIGGGFVNVGGLSIAGGKLYASTMDGLLARALDALDEKGWKDETRLALGVDVTATLSSPDGLWIASRRGLTRVK
jgi:ligand-binding sensor domain-containing protein